MRTIQPEGGGHCDVAVLDDLDMNPSCEGYLELATGEGCVADCDAVLLTDATMWFCNSTDGLDICESLCVTGDVDCYEAANVTCDAACEELTSEECMSCVDNLGCGQCLECHLLGQTDLEYCAPGCPWEWIADGICDYDCRQVAECSFDGDDCSSTSAAPYSTTPAQTCSSHEDCSAGTYCDTASVCYTCNPAGYCCQTNDAIDGVCPCDCDATESPEGEAGLHPWPPASTHNGTFDCPAPLHTPRCVVFCRCEVVSSCQSCGATYSIRFHASTRHLAWPSSPSL